MVNTGWITPWCICLPAFLHPDDELQRPLVDWYPYGMEEGGILSWSQGRPLDYQGHCE